jgi:hypothetical protein
MLATLDLPAVRRFTDELSGRARRCDNGERMEWSALEKDVQHYAILCRELREAIRQWARAIFTGEIEFDTEAENLWKAETGRLLQSAKKIAEQSQKFEGPGYELDGLNRLHRHIADLDQVVAHWVSPRLSVGPAARVKIPEQIAEIMKERLKTLPPMSKDEYARLMKLQNG